MINFALTLFYVVMVKGAVFKEDSFMLLFEMVFFAVQSFFGLIWVLQPFIRSAKMSMLTMGFFFFVSFYLAFLVD